MKGCFESVIVCLLSNAPPVVVSQAAMAAPAIASGLGIDTQPTHMHAGHMGYTHLPLSDMHDSPSLSSRSQEHALQAAQRYVVIKMNAAQGATSCVDIARDRETGQKVAIKRVFKRPGNALAISKEADIHMEISRHGHPNILCLVDVIDNRNAVKFVMPYLSGGDLLDAIPPDSGLSLTRATEYAVQLFSAIAHVHSHGIAHRDIKPENLLLTADHRTLQLCDFGYAIYTASHEARAKRESVGTVPYLAPELFHSRPDDDVDWLAADLWAAGIVIFALYTGRFPWGAAHDGSHEFRLYASGSHSDEERKRWNALPTDVRSFIYSLLSVNPKDRPTASQAHSRMLHIQAQLGMATSRAA